MQEVTRGICRRAAEKMEIQGQPGTSGADGWSLRWVSHNMKTRLRDRYCHRELVPKVPASAEPSHFDNKVYVH